MNDKHKLLVSAITVIVGSTTLATFAMADTPTNLSDTTGIYTSNSTSSNWSFSSGNSGITLTHTNGGGTAQTASGSGGTTGGGDGTTVSTVGTPVGVNLPPSIIDIITATSTGTGTATGIGTNTNSGTTTATSTGTNTDGSTTTATGTSTNTDGGIETAMGTRRATGEVTSTGNNGDSSSNTTGNLPDGDGNTANTGDNGDNVALRNSNCESDLCFGNNEQTEDTVELSFNEIAELIELDLEQSVKQLAAAEAAAKAAESEPRRISRRNSLLENNNSEALDDADETHALGSCPNPAFVASEARKTLQSKLEDSREFIEQVNQINPDQGIW